jgi:glycine cleavage system aminomethyltransferase T
MAAGRPYGNTPYGTETMHLLRAEKGYPIVGQDTGGTVTPHDLGMAWAVSKKEPDFIGKRSFSQSENQNPPRKQLVGLLPVDGLPGCRRARRSSSSAKTTCFRRHPFRCWTTSPQAIASPSSVAELLGVELPIKVSTYAKSAGTTVIWLGPDEWLVTPR